MARQYQSPLQSTARTTSSTTATTTATRRDSIKTLSKDWKMVCSASKQDSTGLSSDGFPALERCWSLSGETSTSSSSTTRSSAELEDASAKRIRAKYFYALGIGLPTLSAPTSPSNASCNSNNNNNNSSQDVAKVQPRIRSILKSSSTYSHTHDDSTRSKGLFTRTTQEAKVMFETQVSIHLIPNRHQLSLQERQELWMLPQELEETAYRNYIEFSMEQWDWQQAIEENDFVWIQGSLTHPAHVLMMQQMMHCTPNRQFCRIFSAQQQSLRQKQQQQHQQHQQYHHQYLYTSHRSPSSSHPSSAKNR